MRLAYSLVQRGVISNLVWEGHLISFGASSGFSWGCMQLKFNGLASYPTMLHYYTRYPSISSTTLNLGATLALNIV